jgi:uncharacterized membrane protein
MEINGLPLHPLVVHAAVVFGSLAAVGALGYVAVPRRRATLRWPMVGLALIGVASLVAAYYTGRSFFDSRPPEIQANPQVLTHEHLARQLFWITLGFGLVALVAGWLSRRTGAVRVVLDVLLAASALAVLVWVARTGDAGARAVWG